MKPNKSLFVQNQGPIPTSRASQVEGGVVGVARSSYLLYLIAVGRLGQKATCLASARDSTYRMQTGSEPCI